MAISENNRTIGIYLILSLSTVIAYWGVLGNDFVSYDDHPYVTNNPNVTTGFTAENIKWAFTTNHMANWHPLTWLSHMADCQFFGLNATYHHVHNLLLHLASTLLLFEVLRRMTGAIWRSAFVAAAFALHPMHVESVAWAAERKDVLSGLLWMLTMVTYLHYVKRRSVLRYLPVMLTFVLGLMAKPMLVTLPFVLLLLDYWPLKRTGLTNTRHVEPKIVNAPQVTVKYLIAEKIPLFVIVALSCIVTLVFQKQAGAMGVIQEAPLNLRIANAAVSYISYLDKFICPRNLAVFYPFALNGIALWKALAAFAVLAVLTVSAFVTARRKPWFIMGWLWYVGTMIPVIGLIHVGMQAMADRYTYLPYIGLSVAVSWALGELYEKLRNLRTALIMICAGAVIGMAIQTSRQVGHWQNSTTLYEHAISVTGDNGVIENNLAEQYYLNGEIDRAIEHYYKATKLYPDWKLIHYNLALALQNKRFLDDAIVHYRKALAGKPDPVKTPFYSDGCYNLGVALAQTGELEQSLPFFWKALETGPSKAEVHGDLANVYMSLNDLGKAAVHYTKAISIDPKLVTAHYNLGLVLTKQGDLDGAIKSFRRSQQLSQGNPAIYFRIAELFAQQGKTTEAVMELKNVLKFEPNNIVALNRAAWYLAVGKDNNLRNNREAVELAEKACRLTEYKRADILDTLAVAYAADGQFGKAVDICQKALQLTGAVGQEQLNAELQTHLELFKQQKPYIEK